VSQLYWHGGILLGLYSLIAVLANSLVSEGQLPISSSSWYRKSLPTFADAIALVRQQDWQLPNFIISSPDTKVVKIPIPIFNRLSIALCWAA